MKFKGIEEADKYSKTTHPNEKMITFREYARQDFLAGYSKALEDIKVPQMLEMLNECLKFAKMKGSEVMAESIEKLIKEATEL